MTIPNCECAWAGGAFIAAGWRDAWPAGTIGGRISPREQFSGADLTKPGVLPDHRPLDTRRNALCGVMRRLSEHTRVGQVRPAGMAGRLLPMADVFCGHMHVENCRVVASSGLGRRGTTPRSLRNPYLFRARLFGPDRPGRFKLGNFLLLILPFKRT